ncbi:MAG: LysR family transcriptional regulator [Burkholderiaceae bacterium]
MKTLRGIASFVAVARTGSFTAAARSEGISAVAVGKNVSTLERHLGVRLVQRSTRRIALTPEGAAFHLRCAGPLRELEAAQSQAQESAQVLSGLLKVTCVSPIATGFLLPLLRDFRALHPGVRVTLNLDDAVNDLIEQGYDVAVRVGPLPDSSLVVRPIAALPFVLCASPGYLASHGAPATLDALAEHDCVRIHRPGRQAPFPWFVAGLDRAVAQRLVGGVAVSDLEGSLAAAEHGLGIACLPLVLALEAIRAGRLHVLLPAHVDASLSLCLHYPSRRNLPARTRAFVDFVFERLRGQRDLTTPHALLLAPFV